MRTYAELVKEAIRAAYEKSENEYKKFEVGRTYATRSVCNSECIFKITIIKRTEKTVTIDEGNKKMDNEEMNLAELLKQTAEENQTRKILAILEESESLEDAKEKVKALLNK